jgi:hypothetical protein
MLKNFLKRVNILVAGVILSLLVATPVYAVIGHRVINAVYSNIKIMFNGDEVEMRDEMGGSVEAFFADGQIYVPINLFAEAIGAGVEWDEFTATLTIDMPFREIDCEICEDLPEPEIDVLAQPSVPLAYMDYLAQSGGKHWRIAENMALNTGAAARGFVGARIWAKTHESAINYFLDGQFETFTGSIALNHETRSAVTRTVIRIYGNERLLFESNVITAGFLPQTFDLNVAGVTVLRLEIIHLSGADWIHAGVADGMLHRAAENQDYTGGY